MIYYFYFSVLVVLSLVASFAGFAWALKSGQFAEQQRARFLPLRDDHPVPRVENPGKAGLEVYFLAAVVISGAALLAAAIWVLARAGGGGHALL